MISWGMAAAIIVLFILLVLLAGLVWLHIFLKNLDKATGFDISVKEKKR
jgi:ABC-type spermidine/putrescine transport system permease subunit I